ncbi:hypothetical protein N9N67_08700, partial [Bacteriovoracaceae bacterium]|nr:hypothetical protein [Bacteriovoracaceae bacterium]
MNKSKLTMAKKIRENDKKRKKQEKLERKRSRAIKRELQNENADEESRAHDDVIGMKVLSLEFGAGKILGIEKIENRQEQFYVIEYGTKKSKNFFPVNNGHVRFISSSIEFDKAINILKSKKRCKTFSSKQERQSYFKDCLKNQKTHLLAKTLAEISCHDDLSPIENKIFEQLTGTLALEASLALSISKSDSKDLIFNSLEMDLK